MTRIDPALPGDYETFLVLFEELATGDPPPPREQFEEIIVPGTLVARSSAGEVLGYVFTQVFDGLAYVRHLVSAPSARRMGVGRALMAAARERARAEGARRWQLNVKVHNAAAIHLYESLGFAPSFETVVVRIAWRDVAQIDAELDPGVRVRRLQGSDGERVERSFELPTALVTGPRGAVPVGAFDERGEPLAFALFNPGFPGVPTFRARAVSPAFAVLKALAAHAVPIDDAARPWRRDGVQLVVEDALEVASTLVERGGVEAFRIRRLVGTL